MFEVCEAGSGVTESSQKKYALSLYLVYGDITVLVYNEMLQANKILQDDFHVMFTK